jgi:ATP-dependent Lhr-like helicase
MSRIYGVPTNAFELVEFAAARRALEQGRIEARRPLRLPLDVLLQHLVTIAGGEGFFSEEMRQEVRSTHAYAELAEQEWQWLLDFMTTGGALRAYPEYQKVKIDEDGRYHVNDLRLARQHRMNLGTIVSAATVQLKMANGKKLGTVEETFISRIKVGQVFIFGGRRLELVRHRGLAATVKAATKKRARGEIPSWQGGKSPLSSELATAVNEQLAAFSPKNFSQAYSPELTMVAPILALQAQWSHLPRPDELLIELTQTREGYHLFLYPFAGRLVNEGVGLLLAYRLTRESAQSIQVTPNDYGVELHSDQPFEPAELDWPALFTTDRLMDDLLGCLNTAELGRHQFREVARVAGLIIQGFPGQEKTLRSLQTSSGLLYDVLARYDPQNLLLQQAQREVLERQLEYSRLEETLRGMQQRRLCFRPCPRLTPMAFPLWADSISTHLSTEDFATRLGRMLDELETAADRSS